MLQSYAKSHIGQRKINEDSFLIDEEIGLYIIADGVGGLEKGEIASKLACDTILNGIKSGLSLNDAVYLAHRTIIGEIQVNKEKQGMATTIVAVLFDEHAYDIVWIGDSRVYIWDEKLKLITKDDSYVELLLENGHIEISELATHPDRNVISQALGIERKSISINSNYGILEDEQTLLLCTDGLYNIANERDIIQSFKQANSIENITNDLVKTAVDKDGKDNITLLLIRNATPLTNPNHNIKPKVYRSFDTETGEILDARPQNAAENIISVEPRELYEPETDPELIDQTSYRDISEQEKELLEAAAKVTIKKVHNSQFILPVILLIILIIIGYLLIK